MWLIYTGVFLIALGTLFTLIGQSKLSESSTTLLAEKSNEIALLNTKIVATVTGGDSFCFLFPNPSFEKTNTIDFYLQNQGKYPMYDVFIRIWDDSREENFDYNEIFEKYPFDQSEIKSKEDIIKMYKDPNYIARSKKINQLVLENLRNRLIREEKLSTFSPNKSFNLMDNTLISCTIPKGIDLNKYSQKYTVDISARNGHFIQSISITIHDMKYHIYSKVEKIIDDSKSEIVREYESIDGDGFAIKNLK